MPTSSSHVSPTAAAAEIISLLKEKSVDELRKLLTDKEAYNNFLLSLDQVKTQNNVGNCLCKTESNDFEDYGTRQDTEAGAIGLDPLDYVCLVLTMVLKAMVRDELLKETLEIARENLEEEPRIRELRNQCRIIRTTELAAAQEKVNELERQKEEILKCYSPASLILRVQEAMNKPDRESEALHRLLLDREIELVAFVQKYKMLRTAYHRRALTHLAAKTSTIG